MFKCLKAQVNASFRSALFCLLDFDKIQVSYVLLYMLPSNLALKVKVQGHLSISRVQVTSFLNQGALYKDCYRL